MADYITLLGAEGVQSAGRSMQSAAEQMQRAADSFESAVAAHNNIFLERLEQILREDREARIADAEKMQNVWQGGPR